MQETRRRLLYTEDKSGQKIDRDGQTEDQNGELRNF